jgi:hypothetical protein
MRTSTLVFDPLSAEHYDDPYETYRRMRNEAPVYCREQYVFYTLSRHEGAASAVHRSEGKSL